MPTRVALLQFQTGGVSGQVQGALGWRRVVDVLTVPSKLQWAARTNLDPSFTFGVGLFDNVALITKQTARLSTLGFLKKMPSYQDQNSLYLCVYSCIHLCIRTNLRVGKPSDFYYYSSMNASMGIYSPSTLRKKKKKKKLRSSFEMDFPCSASTSESAVTPSGQSQDTATCPSIVFS